MKWTLLIGLLACAPAYAAQSWWILSGADNHCKLAEFSPWMLLETQPDFEIEHYNREKGFVALVSSGTNQRLMFTKTEPMCLDLKVLIQQAEQGQQ